MEKLADSYFTGILLGIAGVCYFIYLAYWPWIKPEEWRKKTRRYRRKAQKNWPFLPENLVYQFLKGKPNLDLWYARIGYLIMIILSITTIVISYLSLIYLDRFK